MKSALNAALTAVFAIIAFGLLVATASTCRFVRVIVGDVSSFFGVYCTNGYVDDNDALWIVARVMLGFALALDILSTGLAIAIAWFTYPTKNRWQAISMMAAISAVFKVPVFLAFQADPCSDVECEFTLGGYFLLFSITFSIAVTILTQCLEPPTTPGRIEVQRKFDRSENPNPRNEDRLSINRTMTEDEEERLMTGGVKPQEAVVGDTQSQTILLGESESQNMVIRNVMTRDTEISALTENVKELESTSLDQAAPSPATEPLSAVQTEMGDGSVSEYTYSQDLLRVEEVRYTMERLAKDESPSPPPPPPPTAPESTVANDLIRTPTDMELDVLLEEPSELQSAPSELVKPCRSDDLGSLAPTITGDDSILDQSRDTATSDDSAKRPDTTATEDLKIINVDRTQKAMTQDTKPSKNISDTVQKVMTSPFDLGKALVTRAKRKRRLPSRLKCYRLMDDDDMESTYPISPPLEILTVKLSTDSDQEERPPTEHEKALIDQWNALHGNTMTPHSMNDDDPDLYLSSDDESGDDLQPPTRSVGYLEDGESRLKSQVEGRSSRTLVKKRAKKSRSRRIVYSGLSVASGPSLLSMDNVIEEETAADLEESSASEQGTAERFDPYGAILAPVPITRSRSAPNLAGFARQKTEHGNVHEELKLTGMHSYHSAEIFRDVGRSTRSLTGRRSRMVSLSPKPQKAPILDSRSLPPAKKTPLFRQERARNGIHRSHGNLSDHSSSDDNRSRSIRSLGVLSQRARLARIRRLQRLPFPSGSTSSAGKTPPKANRIHEYSTPPKQGSRPDVAFYTSPKSGGTDRSARSAGTISSGNISCASDCYSIDLLDVQLAELSRPDGGSKGPDEESF